VEVFVPFPAAGIMTFGIYFPSWLGVETHARLHTFSETWEDFLCSLYDDVSSSQGAAFPTDYQAE
jgi:hypothetical protein